VKAEMESLQSESN